MNRLAVLQRERAAIFARLAEIEAEMAIVYAEGEGEAANDQTNTVKRQKPQGMPPVVRVPAGRAPSEISRAKAAAALRRNGYR